MVADNQDSHRVPNNPEQAVVWKTPQIRTPQIFLTEGEQFGVHRHFKQEAPQLCIEVFRQLRTGDPLVIPHDREDIGLQLGMEDNPH